jgi:serine/threonine protein kinase
MMIGRILGHYRIIEKIGEGGMGQVFKAHDEHLDRDVAIKVMREGCLPDERTRKRFRKEAIALSKLNHANIATVFDFDRHEDIDFIAMEYIPGKTLSEIESGQELDVDRVIDFGLQLAQGLAAAHRQGVIHRDLKPGNIRITPDCRLKILDFGLAKFFQHDDPKVSRDTISVEHGTAGTPSYMSPEQLCGEKLNPASDLFCAGIVLYEMLTGKNPFKDLYSQSTSYNVLHKDPPPPSEVVSDVPPELDSIVLRLLKKRPEDRFSSAEELETALSDSRTRSGTDEIFPRRNRLIRRLSFGLGAIAVIVLFILYFNLPIQSYSNESQGRTIRRLTFTGKADIPIWSPDGNNIAFKNEQEIRVISPDGTASRKIDTGRFFLTAWDWTPDGKAILCHGYDPEKRINVIVSLGLYGEEPRVLVQNARFPAMSADGKMLLYTRNRPRAEYGIYLTDLENGEERKIAEPSGEGTYVYKSFFSPDMSKIAYIRWNGLGHELWVVNSDGSNDRMVQSDPIQLGGRYSWTADGKSFIIAGQLHNRWSIWQINLSGEGHIRLTAGSEQERHVTKAPDEICFVYGRQEDKSRTAILDIRDGSIIRPVGMNVATKHPLISEDNRFVLFQALVNEEWQIWKAPIEGEGQPKPIVASEDLSCFGPVRGREENILYIRGRIARETRWGKMGWKQTIWCSNCDGGMSREIREAGDRIERIAPTPYRSGRLLYSADKSVGYEIIQYLDESGVPHKIHEDSRGDKVSGFDWGYSEDEILVARTDTSLQINRTRVVSSLNIRSGEINNLFTMDSLLVDGSTGLAGWIHAIALSPKRDILSVLVGQYMNQKLSAVILLYDRKSSTARMIKRIEGEELPEYMAWAPDGNRIALGLFNSTSDIYISEPEENWTTAMR